MKISKAIVAAVGAAVYAKKKLEETQTPLRKKSLTVWKNGEVTHKEIIRKPISEEEQTNAINSRIDEAVRRYKPMSERGNGETETEPEIAPVNFTFTQSEDDGDPGVSFERVFDHFNRLESSVGNEGEDAGESGKKAEDTAEEALPAVTAVEENFDEQAGMPKQMLLEKGIMTSAPIANAVQELAEMPSVIQDNEEIEDVNMPVDDSIFDLYASEPVEDAVKAFEEIAEQEETADSEAAIDSEQNDTATEEAVSEPVEDAVKALEEIAEQEETADSEAEIESKQNDIATEEAVSEPVEEAVKALEEIAEQEETADSEAAIDDEQNDTATEEAVSEPVEEAVKAFEEIAEQDETDDSETEIDSEQNDTATEESVSEPVEDAVKAFEEIAEQEETADSKTEIDSEQNDTATEEAVSEPVEDAVKAFEEIAQQDETTDSEAEIESEQNDTATEEAVSEPVEDAVKAFEEIAEQEETADSEAVIDDEQNETATEEAVSEPVEDAIKAFEEIAEQEETADSEEESLEEQFHTIMAEETASEPVSSLRTAESVEDALKEFGDFIGISETADSTGSTGSSGSTGSTEDISDDDLEQTSGIFEESTLSDELSETPDEPIDADEKPRTMDFFDLPDEAYTPAQVTEEKHDENVAEVEDLFGNLLMDDEPEAKKTFNDPSEVFSLFDTADGGQDDFDKYSDEKIEEESEKKKTSDTRKYIAQDIADNIASFAQLLEPLNAIKENKIRSKSGILFDWEMRIQALIGDLPIKTYWRNNFRNYEIWSDEKCMEKAGELLSMLELVGIVRDKAKEVVIDKDTLDFYSAQSEHLNNDFHIGETVVVTRPCWKINGRPARKGEIAKKAPFAEFSRKKVSPLETMLRENSCSDGDVNIPVTDDNFCTYDREIPYVKRAIAEGFCKCAVRRMEDGGALAFFYEVIAEGENVHYSPCTLRFEVNIDKNANVVGRFRSEKV